MDKGKNELPLPSATAFIGSSGWLEADRHSIDANSGTARYRGVPSLRRASGGAPNSPKDPQVGIMGDILIRGLGLLGIGLAALAGLWLHHKLHGADAANPTSGEYAVAAMMFVAASLGSGLLILGRHIHDRIEVAERWRRRW